MSDTLGNRVVKAIAQQLLQLVFPTRMPALGHTILVERIEDAGVLTPLAEAVDALVEYDAWASHPPWEVPTLDSDKWNARVANVLAKLKEIADGK